MLFVIVVVCYTTQFKKNLAKIAGLHICKIRFESTTREKKKKTKIGSGTFIPEGCHQSTVGQKMQHFWPFCALSNLFYALFQDFKNVDYLQFY